MKTFSSKTQGFEHTDEENNSWEVFAYVVGTIDSDYGSDSDGNRGSKEYFIDEHIYAEWFYNGIDTDEIKIPLHIKDILKKEALGYKEWEVE